MAGTERQVVIHSCFEHTICTKGYVQTPVDVDFILQCMEHRGVLRKTIRNKYALPKR